MKKIRANQLYTAIETILLFAANNPEDKMLNIGTEYEDLISPAAIQHRKTWKDISYLRYYVELLESSKKAELNQILHDAEQTTTSTKQRFYRLIEVIDRADYGTTVFDIMQR